MNYKNIISFLSAFVLTSGILSFQFNNFNSISDIEDKAILSLMENDDLIDKELLKLEGLEKIIYSENLDYNTLAKTNHSALKNLNVAEEVESEIFAGSNDLPAGIPGFWWGFCFSLVGLLIVYLVMDDSPDRKKQVNNALYGCIASTVLTLLLQVVLTVWASTI